MSRFFSEHRRAFCDDDDDDDDGSFVVGVSEDDEEMGRKSDDDVLFLSLSRCDASRSDRRECRPRERREKATAASTSEI